MKNSENKTILDYETVDFNKEENCLVIIDQTLLPGKTEIIELKTAQEIWDAIYLLKVRGAPAIGVAAAFGIYQLSFEIWKNRKDITCEEFEKQFLEQKEFLNSSRPTAVNLSWALNRMEKVLPDNRTLSIQIHLKEIRCHPVFRILYQEHCPKAHNPYHNLILDNHYTRESSCLLPGICKLRVNLLPSWFRFRIKYIQDASRVGFDSRNVCN